MDVLEKLKQVRFEIEKQEPVSAYKRGVKAYALELLDKLISSVKSGLYKQDVCSANLERYLLDGAESWTEYSEGGSSLIYNSDIVERLYPPSVVRKTNYGASGSYKGESFLDIQARALTKAARILRNKFEQVSKEDKETVNG